MLKKSVGVSMAALALVAAVSAGAKGKNSIDVLLAYDASLAGSHVASGRYRLQWETHSPGATVTLQRGSKVVASVEAKVEDRGAKYSRNAVIYDEKPDGSRIILEIQLKGSSEALVFSY